jgi:hypothetical protein
MLRDLIKSTSHRPRVLSRVTILSALLCAIGAGTIWPSDHAGIVATVATG